MLNKSLNKYSIYQKAGSSQSGSTLLVSLLLLMIITIGGLSALSIGVINLKSTANFMDRNTAYQETENQLFWVMSASGGEWFDYAPTTLTSTAVVDRYKHTATLTRSIPQTTLTMTLFEIGNVRLSEQREGSSVNQQAMNYDTRSQASFGVSETEHRMILQAELPLSGSGDQNEDGLK